jgi:hypothetical protein
VIETQAWNWFSSLAPLNGERKGISECPPPPQSSISSTTMLRDPTEKTMKSVLAIAIAALLFLSSCSGNKAMTPEELEAYRKSNERYERSKGP